MSPFRERMRVLCIATAYPRHSGDHITPWLPELIRRLSDVGIEVEILASSYRGLGDQRVDGVTVHRFRYAPSALERLTHDRSAPAQLRETPALAVLIPSYIASGRAAAQRLALSGRFDLVHALWPVPHALIGAAARRAARIAQISTFFGSELAWRGVARSVVAPLVRAAVTASDVATAISHYTGDLLRQLAPGAAPRIIPIGAAIEPEAVATSSGTTPLELLYVGRLTRRKGVHVLLEAAAQSRAALAIRIVGEGNERAELERRAAMLGLGGRVTFDGFVPRAELVRRYASCDLFVLPSLGDVQGDVEGLGVPAIEASAFGKPVIATSVGGIREIVLDGATGVLVPPDAPGALAAAIDALAKDPARREAMGRAGREHVARTFSWSAIIDALAQAYDDARARYAREHPR